METYKYFPFKAAEHFETVLNMVASHAIYMTSIAVAIALVVFGLIALRFLAENRLSIEDIESFADELAEAEEDAEAGDQQDYLQSNFKGKKMLTTRSRTSETWIKRETRFAMSKMFRLSLITVFMLCSTTQVYAQDSSLSCDPSTRADGCSVPSQVSWLFGDADKTFKDACNAHDACYSTPGSGKASCDSAFKSNMLSACGNDLDCAAAAGIFYEAVKDFGGTSYADGQKWGYQNCTDEPVVILFEGNEATQDVVCILPLDEKGGYNLTKDNVPCLASGTGSTLASETGLADGINDEARSAKLVNAKKGTVIEIFDNSSGNREDDFARIEVNRDKEKFTVDSFEEDNINCISAKDPGKINIVPCNVQIFSFYNTNLDGKVSRINVYPPDTYPEKPRVVFYEGNKGTQNIVCTLDASKSTNIKLKDKSCDNDEIRSMVLSEVPAGTVIRVYDDGGGSTSKDDYAYITVKKKSEKYTVNTFEKSYEDSYVEVVYKKGGNLDGKISRIKIEP